MKATTSDSPDLRSVPTNYQELDAWLDKRLEEKEAEKAANKTSAMAIIATKGTLDMAYPPFILASTAAAMGWEVRIFFTFWGLSLLRKELNLEISPLGNPAMHMKLPYGPEWLRDKELKIPNAVMSLVPGFDKFATRMLKQTAANKGVASIEQLRELSIEAGVKLIVCQMTMDLFKWSREDFIDEIDDWVGAASFLPFAQQADVSIFI